MTESIIEIYTTYIDRSILFLNLTKHERLTRSERGFFEKLKSFFNRSTMSFIHTTTTLAKFNDYRCSPKNLEIARVDCWSDRRTIRSIPLRALRRGLLRKHVELTCDRALDHARVFPTGLRKHPREQRRREPPRFRYARSDDRERRAGTGCARSYRHPRTSARTGSAG